jgi:hypothetical protein
VCSAQPDGSDGRGCQHCCGHDGYAEGLLRCCCNVGCSLALHGCFALKMFRRFSVSDPPTELTVPERPRRSTAKRAVLRILAAAQTCIDKLATC